MTLSWLQNQELSKYPQNLIWPLYGLIFDIPKVVQKQRPSSTEGSMLAALLPQFMVPI